MQGNVPNEVIQIIQAITNEIINPIIAVLFAAALTWFLWGLLMFILSADDTTKKTQYKSHMLWGIIGMTVMVSVFAILAVLLATFGVQPGDIPPQLPLNNSL